MQKTEWIFNGVGILVSLSEFLDSISQRMFLLELEQEQINHVRLLCNIYTGAYF